MWIGKPIVALFSTRNGLVATGIEDRNDDFLRSLFTQSRCNIERKTIVSTAMRRITSYNVCYTKLLRSVHLNMKLDKLKIDFLKPYLDGVVQNIRGLASGKMKLIGSLKKPQFDGAVFMQNAFVDIDLLGTTYNLTSYNFV